MSKKGCEKPSLRTERLCGELRVVQEEMNRRAKVPGAQSEAWESHARASLEGAEQEATAGRLQSAWTQLHHARRLLLESFAGDDAERLAKALALQAEADEKLKNWRRRAVRDVLALDPRNPQAPTVGAVVLGQFLLDEHFDNGYFKLELLSRRIRGLTYLLLGVLAVLGAAVWLRPTPEPGGIFTSPAKLGMVLLLGAAGAALSIALSLSKLTGRIPEILTGTMAAAVRPLVGALSAVVVVSVLQALPTGTTMTSHQLHAYALVAGFSDQLVVRMIAAAENSISL